MLPIFSKTRAMERVLTSHDGRRTGAAGWLSSIGLSKFHRRGRCSFRETLRSPDACWLFPESTIGLATLQGRRRAIASQPSKYSHNSDPDNSERLTDRASVASRLVFLPFDPCPRSRQPPSRSPMPFLFSCNMSHSRAFYLKKWF